MSTATDIPGITFRPYNYMRLKGCRFLRLIDGPLLACQILQEDLTYKEAWVDLNGLLGNDNGVFWRHAKDFTRTTTNIRLLGSTLYGDLRNSSGAMSPSSINLTDILEAKGNLLRPLNNDVSEEYYNYEIVPDISSQRHWLPYGGNCRLLVHAMSRRWILLATCPTGSGVLRESAVDLSPISSSYWNIMHGRFDIPNAPDDANRVKVDEGRLTACYVTNHTNFKQWHESSIIEYHWAEKTIDLKGVMANQGGRLGFLPRSDCFSCSSFFCAGFFYNPVLLGRTRRTHVDTAVLNKKVKGKACTLCNLLHDTIRKCSKRARVHEVWLESKSSAIGLYHAQPNLELVMQTTEKHSRFTLTTRSTNEPQATQRFTIMLDPGGESYPFGGVPEHLQTIRQNLMPSYLCPQKRWNVVKAWVTECVNGHDDCKGKRETDLPSRFLEIGENDTDVVRVETSAKGQKGTYACLSHCWGGKNTCMLTTSTAEQFSKSIPKSLLPRVFSDAIGVCRRLGIKKLWIDSLCIQQDSKEDWEKESRKMGQYYSNCVVCIAATNSSNSAGTLELTKYPDDVVVRSKGQDPVTGPFCLLAIPSELLEIRHFARGPQRTQPPTFPLMTRAWVMQERWLSPRTLHFCGAEIVFECAKMTVCECGRASQDITNELEAKHHKFLRSTTSSKISQLRENIDRYTWPDIVTNYSALDLSHPTDRLVALSGLASIKEYRYIRYDQAEGLIPRYLAGLWRDHLANQLAWYVGETLLVATSNRTMSDSTERLAARRPKPQEYLAPSWSWASVTDPVSYVWYDGGNGEPLFELLDAQISLSSEDPYGAVQEGCYILVHVRLLNTSWESVYNAGASEAIVLNDLVGTQQLNRENRKGILFSPDYLLTDLEDSEQLAILPLSRLDVLFAMAEGTGDLARVSRTTMCLVLREVKNRSLANHDNVGVYQRVGFTEYVSFANGVRNVDTNDYTEQDIIII
ncbi:heterokaryon incompatibility protein-domain-containing protein [Xylaria arbuscula]|nr:heterokaryon incompatibility protein-domain-containing protein [Xylaria arbuscula]